MGVQRVLDVMDVERDLADGPRSFPAEGARGEVVWEGVALRSRASWRSAVLSPGQSAMTRPPLRAPPASSATVPVP